MDARTLKNNLAHSRAAYRHAYSALPSPKELQSGPIHQNQTQFTKESQIYSQLIELGWAFYCRYEGGLEYFLKENAVELSKDKPLLQWLIDHEVSISSDYSVGLKKYREIRNALHHDDGQINKDNPNIEYQFLPEHMENFFNLFCWIGEQVEQVNRKKNSS